MKKNIFCGTVILFVLALVFSCSQDPIFYTISTEPIPVKPRIQGGPTNMVVFKRGAVPIMYVASGDLHWYAKNGWDSAEYGIPQPGGKVIGLAATSEHLYALCITGTGVTTVLRRIGPVDNGWSNIGSAEGRYTLIQSIFTTTGTTDRLFAGAMNNSGSDYGILYLDNTTLRLIASDTEMLSGAARLGDIHYMSTRGRGIFSISETGLSSNQSAQQLDEEGNPDGKNRLFMGMIQLNDKDGSILVVERNGGAFFEVQAAGFRQLRYSNGDTVATGRFATGALALWQQASPDDNGIKMLIAGIQGGLFSTTISSSYSHGYVEFFLNPDGSLDLESICNDPPSITVDGNTDRYTATIGKHPINHMFQAPKSIDDRMTFFASTQTSGLWSYKERSDGLQWNAEN